MAESINFWRLFHSLLRANSSKKEGERAKANLQWATDYIVQIKAVCTPDYELDLIGVVWEYWQTHKEAPSLNMLNELILKRDKSETLQEAIAEYEGLAATEAELQNPYDVQDMYQVLKDKTDEFELWRLNAVLDSAKRIANGSIEDPKTKKKLSGSRDSLNFILGKIQDGMFTNRQSSVGGNLKDSTIDLKDAYQRNKKENQHGTGLMKTGIENIDSVIRGLKRGQFWGVLGFAGQRKSSLCRSIVYNIAQQGFRVMHVPLEQSYEEERNIYTIIHSYHPKFGGKYRISIHAFEDGNLTLAEEDFLLSVVAPDLESIPGDIIIRQPTETTWEGIKSQVELQHQATPLDLLLVDYWSLMDTSYAQGNDRAIINGLIKNGKSWCLNFDNKRGICLVTPVQGNRDGYSEAESRDGKWEMDGVYDYSEFDKSLDGCMYTYLDDGLKSSSNIKIGVCKNRRSDIVAPFFATVIPESGFIQGSQGGGAVEKTLNDLLDPEL